MLSTWVFLNCLIVLISCLLKGINGANASCVIDLHVTYKFFLCLDDNYYECYPNNNNNNNNNGENIVNVSVNASTSDSGGKLTFISYFNEKNLLEKAGCRYISNRCPSGNDLVLLNCKSNLTNLNASVSISSSNGTNCVVDQTNDDNDNDNAHQLICSVIINANNKDYLYAFIAVVIIVIVLFCLCPICCIYQFCRYCQENEFYQSYHGRKSKKCNNNNNIKHTTSSGTTSNKRISKCDGDVSYEDRAVLFSTVMKKKTVKTEQQMEAQPINKSSCSVSRDGYCNTNANAEVVV